MNDASADAPSSGNFRGPRRLWAYGLGMLLPAGYLAWRYPLWPHADQLTDLGRLSNYAVAPFIAWAASVAIFFLLYLLAIRECQRVAPDKAWRPIFVCGALLAGTMAMVYPFNAIDIFIYAVRSRLFTEYGENPIAVEPISHRDDPWLPFASLQWADDVSPYGPLWNWIAAPATLLSGEKIEVAVVVYKLLAAVCALIGALIAGRAVGAVRPDLAPTASLIYLWSPLVLYEGVANGHNDVVLAEPLLLAIFFWQQQRDAWVIPALVASVWIKYVTILLLPLAAVAIWRRSSPAARPGLIAKTTIASVVVTLASFAPFFDPSAVWESIDRQSSIVMTSPTALAVELMQPAYTYDQIVGWARWVGIGVVGVALAFGAVATWREFERFPRAGFEVLFVYLLVAALTFRSWYVIWIVALAAVLPLGWPFWRATSWSFGAVAAYGLFIWGWEWWKVDYSTLLRPGIAILFGPPLLATIAEVVVRAKRRRGA